MQIKHVGQLFSIAALAVIVTGCATTHQARSLQETSGFLGDYSQLKEGGSGEAKLLYINPNADFSKYNKVMIDRVQLWKSEEADSPLGSLSAKDQQFLVDTLYSSLEEKLSGDYEIVDKAGPGVLRLRAAITEARKSKPVMDLVSNVTPIGLGLTYAKRVTFGTHTSVGLVTGELEILDAQTNERLAAGVDRRAGTKVLRGKFAKWGDVKDAFDYWGRRVQTRLAELRHKQP